MTFNRMKYKRTADVDTIIYHGVDLSTEKQGTHPSRWNYIELVDYSGDSQTMRKGDKLNMLKFFSLVYHHNAYINYDVWTIWKGRPLIYLNISCTTPISSPSYDKREIISSLTRTTILKRKSTTTTALIIYS